MLIPLQCLPICRNQVDLASYGEGSIRPATIYFEPGWNNPENSDVHNYTTEQATTALGNYSDDLRGAIDSNKCNIRVTKGCHQATSPHFTLSETGANKKCSSLYAGSRSIHVPC